MNSSRIKKRKLRRKEEERKRNIRNGALAFSVIAIFIVLLMQAGSLARPLASEEVIASGKRVYSETCAVCHGVNLEGHAALPEAPALDGSEHAWHHPDGQIQALINDGGTLMPAMADQLSDEEIVAVIRYIQSNWQAKQLAFQQDASQGFPLQY